MNNEEGDERQAQVGHAPQEPGGERHLHRPRHEQEEAEIHERGSAAAAERERAGDEYEDEGVPLGSIVPERPRGESEGDEPSVAEEWNGREVQREPGPVPWLHDPDEEPCGDRRPDEGPKRLFVEVAARELLGDGQPQLPIAGIGSEPHEVRDEPDVQGGVARKQYESRPDVSEARQRLEPVQDGAARVARRSNGHSSITRQSASYGQLTNRA